LHIFALSPPRAELYVRINERAARHFQAGLVEEVRTLLDAGVPAASNALGAHGYRRAVEHLKGERTLESATEQTQLDVRHYAKRQMTWFRREPGVQWIEGFGDSPAVQKLVAKRVRKLLEAKEE
jgi:tRNA dimethylallyltransferase